MNAGTSPPNSGVASHESPLVLAVPANVRPGEAMRRVLAHPEVRQLALPPLWDLELAGLDLAAALPSMVAVTIGNLPEVVDAAARLATPEALEALCRRMWSAVDEQVRGFYLRRSARDVLARLFGRLPRSIDVPPPEAFREDRVAEHAFTAQYRLAPGAGERNVLAPAEEASLVLYPFDPSNARARRDLALGPGADTLLEVFAYAEGRARHRVFLEGLARTHAWRLHDPLAD